MGNRGNQDYYKISGSRIEETELAGFARQKMAEQVARDRHREMRPSGPQATPVHPHRPPEFKHAAERVPEPSPRHSTERPLPPPPAPSRTFFTSLRHAWDGGFRLGRWVGEMAVREARHFVGRRLERVARRAYHLARRLER